MWENVSLTHALQYVCITWELVQGACAGTRPSLYCAASAEKAGTYLQKTRLANSLEAQTMG